MKTITGAATLAATLILAAGCGNATGPGAGPNVSLSFSTRPAGVAAAPARAAASTAATAADTLSDGTNTLVITSAQLVLKKIELERQDAATCDSTPEPAGCEDFETGPLLVGLPLDTGAMQQVAVAIPPGTYTGVQFEVHSVSGSDAQDSTFLQQHPDFAGISMRVQGTYNGTPFTYTTDLDVEQELELAAPLVVSDTTKATNLTISVVVADWFKAMNGTLIDPATAAVGQPNEGLVKDNIKNSMKAFEDRNEDGNQQNG